MKHWENRLSAALLLVSGLTLAAILVLNLWIAPPGSGMVLIEAESRAEESSIESLPMPEPPGPPQHGDAGGARHPARYRGGHCRKDPRLPGGARGIFQHRGTDGGRGHR